MISDLKSSLKKNILLRNPIYKPFIYPGANEFGKKQSQSTWLPHEVPITQDVIDGKTKISEQDKNILKNIFRFFTQSDIEVSNAYVKFYLRIFKATEIQIILLSFAYIETIHIDAYAFLLDTLDMPEIEYRKFLEYEAIKEKYEYLQNFNFEGKSNGDSEEGSLAEKNQIAVTLAMFSAFIEGVQLFGSFAILLSFAKKRGLIKGICQIIAGSIRDETLHTHSMIKLFHEFKKENLDLDNVGIEQQILKIAKEVLLGEYKFLDLVFEQGDIPNITKSEVINYLHWLIHSRLKQLNILKRLDLSDTNYAQGDFSQEDPLAGIADFFTLEFANFFDGAVTEYSKSQESGDLDGEKKES